MDRRRRTEASVVVKAVQTPLPNLAQVSKPIRLGPKRSKNR